MLETVLPLFVAAEKARGIFRGVSFGKAFLVWSVMVFTVHGAATVGLGAQSREECNKCCAEQGFDEYYLDQCKLKCFRNHDHCVGGAAKHRPPAAETPRAETPRATEPRPEARPPRASLRFPDPLNLVPGREWEAANQILALNGIPAQHPNHQRALKAVEAILVQFGKQNPQGGNLPVAVLGKIIQQYR